MFVKSLVMYGLIFASFSAAAFADDDSETCRRVEDTFRGFEAEISCGEAMNPQIREYEPYRAMCFGCDPKRDVGEVIRANNSENDAFDEGEAEGVSFLAGLNRLPTGKALLDALMPNRKRDCTGGSTAPDCIRQKELNAILFSGIDNGETGPLSVSEATLRKSNDDARGKVQKVLDSVKKKGQRDKDQQIYAETCRDVSSKVAVSRKAHNETLGSEKKKIWKNVLGLVSGTCMSKYVADYPKVWCKDGENPETCIARLEKDPDDRLARFAKYSADPATLLARSLMGRDQKNQGITENPSDSRIDTRATTKVEDLKADRKAAGEKVPDVKTPSSKKTRRGR